MEKLQTLRKLMEERGVDAYLITNGDAHSSEYVTGHWKTVAWFSGFTGSNGTVVVTRTHVGLWTDGRYFIQAEGQLANTGIELYKMGTPGTPTVMEYLAKELPHGGKLGFDGRVVDVREYEKISATLKDKAVTFAYAEDLIGAIWPDRPGLPVAPAFEHEARFAGASAGDKLAAVREKMAKHDVSAYLITALDSVAWLMNIRGRDVSFTPVAYAYVLVTTDAAHVFIDHDKIASFAPNLEAQGFTIHGYDQLLGFLGQLKTSCDKKSQTDLNVNCDNLCCKLLYDPAKTSVAIAEAVPEGVQVVKDLEVDIVVMLKAVKSQIELENSRNAYLKEGVALVRLLKWLEEHTDIPSLTEGDVARKITSLREEQADFLEDGFSTIVAVGGNAAQAHYSPGPVGANLVKEGFLLIDSGAQYLDGTTDTTRTIPMGAITDEMKRDYTLVLKGHIALSRVVFPAGTTGVQLDALARLALWEYGLDFRHGTGHGIGYCLAVHEGPQGVSKRSQVALEPGMMLSNEPAFYVDGQYGVRTENILAVEKRCETEYGVFLGFETLTYCPIDTTAIDVFLLTPGEVEYLNAYHRKTYELLAPRLGEGERAWLSKATQPIG